MRSGFLGELLVVLWVSVAGAAVQGGIRGPEQVGQEDFGWPEVRATRVRARVEEDRSAVIFAGRTINTRGAAERFARSKEIRDKIEEVGEKVLTKRGTAVYVVQFVEPIGEAEREVLGRLGVRVHGDVPHEAVPVSYTHLTLP
ncbi:MAG: hypothetical protein N2595_00245, partial [bacterium]|nr:hypothetical protein [bacterium]